jgi:hypothetical protein
MLVLKPPHKTAVRRHHDKQMRVVTTGSGEQLGRACLVGHAGRQVREHALHLLSVGARGFSGVLRALEL